MDSTSTPLAPTLGVEEEFLLVDPGTGLPAPMGPAVVAFAAERFGADLGEELALAQVEARSGVCRDLADLRAQLHSGRAVTARAARALGCRVLAVGLPVVGGPEVDISRDGRYGELGDVYLRMAAEQSICGCHVHVAVPDPETAVQVCNHVRPWLAVLSMLTANSPISDGRDTGYASWRSVVWSRWPAAGPPPYFESADHYNSVTDLLVTSGAALDARSVYWDVRPSAHLPTVEVRIGDVAATVDEALLFAALTRALVAAALADIRAGVPAPRVSAEVLRAASWRAARYGVTGLVLDVLTGELVLGRTLVDRLVDRVAEQLVLCGDFGVVRELLTGLDLRGTGAMRQRAALNRSGNVGEVIDLLTAETVSGGWAGSPSLNSA